MISSAYDIKDIKLILELNDSARQTLLIMLDQFNGATNGTFDRSSMNNAQKQKMKRGIKELKRKKIISKSTEYRSDFEINTQILAPKGNKSAEDHYLNSGLYDLQYYGLLRVVIAIEHFFDDFFNKKFVIDYYKPRKSPRIPALVFKEIVDYTHDGYEMLAKANYFHGTILKDLIDKANFIKSYCDLRQTHFNLDDDNVEMFLYWFRDLIKAEYTMHPPHRQIQADALCKFIREWFLDNYPEFYV